MQITKETYYQQQKFCFTQVLNSTKYSPPDFDEIIAPAGHKAFDGALGVGVASQ